MPDPLTLLVGAWLLRKALDVATNIVAAHTDEKLVRPLFDRRTNNDIQRALRAAWTQTVEEIFRRYKADTASGWDRLGFWEHWYIGSRAKRLASGETAAALFPPLDPDHATDSFRPARMFQSAAAVREQLLAELERRELLRGLPPPFHRLLCDRMMDGLQHYFLEEIKRDGLARNGWFARCFLELLARDEKGTPADPATTEALRRHWDTLSGEIRQALGEVAESRRWRAWLGEKLEKIDRQTVEIAERQREDSLRLQDVQATAQETLSRVSVLDRPGEPPPARVFASVPPVPDCFTGRAKILAELDTALTPGARFILTGIGGVGKSTVAAKVAHALWPDRFSYVFWLNADSPERVGAGLREIARALHRGDLDAVQEEANARRWLAENGGWLLVADNADDLPAVLPLLPASPQGCLLLTARPAATGGLHSREVDALPPEEGAAFLLRRANRAEATATEAERADARRLAERLGGLPLALDQAGAYMEEAGCSPADYLRLYEANRREFRARRGAAATAHAESVEGTFSLAFDRLAASHPAAAELLRLCALLAPDPIPETIFTAGASALGGVLSPVAADEAAWNEAVMAARRLALAGRMSLLLSNGAPMQALTIHRMVQEVICDGMPEAEQRVWAERAVRAVNAAFPAVEFTDWPLCERLLPHARACAAWIEQFGLMFAEAARLLNQAGYYLNERAQYAEAEPLYGRALAIREKALGPDHPDTAQSLNNLAMLYQAQGRLAEAEPLYGRALAIYEKALGKEHPFVATSLNNLALLYRAQGRLAEAEPLFARALAIFERALGSEHPDTATVMENLVVLLRALGRKREAADLEARARVARQAHARRNRG